jgi:SAM-dependent methyltransferase
MFTAYKNQTQNPARQAAETLSLEQAIDRLPQAENWVGKILKRIEPLLSSTDSLKVLDIGCAQGRALVALARHNHKPYGIDPWPQAIQVAHQLSAQMEVSATVKLGSAENIPFEDCSFDIVLATSVMEHVGDLEQALSEIHRVLRPSGVFWFYSASAMSPLQNEISGFPFFGWYPDSLKRRIMLWAKEHRPWLVGYTKTPALHWWTPGKAQKKLTAAGFVKVWNRWELRHPGESSASAQHLVALARRYKLLRFLGDIIMPECSYAAQKAPGDKGVVITH